MGIALKTQEPVEYAVLNDRPGWIPPEIISNWDTNPYAYQTEEELMLVNADVNGAYNIIIKAVPEAFADGIEGVAVHPVRVS